MFILRPRANAGSEGAVAVIRSDTVYSALVSRCVDGADDILPATFDELVRIPLDLEETSS